MGVCIYRQCIRNEVKTKPPAFRRRLLQFLQFLQFSKHFTLYSVAAADTGNS